MNEAGNAESEEVRALMQDTFSGWRIKFGFWGSGEPRSEGEVVPTNERVPCNWLCHCPRVYVAPWLFW